MYLNGNQLIGKIPAATAASASSVAAGWAAGLLAGFSDTTAMRRLSLASNMLTGTIPAGLWRIRMQASCTESARVPDCLEYRSVTQVLCTFHCWLLCLHGYLSE